MAAKRTMSVAAAVGVMVAVAAGAAAAEPAWQAVLSPQNSLELGFARDNQPVFGLVLAGWGPRWGWTGLSSRDKAAGGKLQTQVKFVATKTPGEAIDVRFSAQKAGPRQLALRYELSAERDVPLTMLIASVSLGQCTGRIALTHADGSTSELKLPLGIGARPPASRAVLHLDGAGAVEMAFEPALVMAHDRDLRVQLAADKYPRGQRTAQITLTFPGEVTFLAGPEDMARMTRTLADESWFAWQSANDLGPSVLGMEGWLDKPAGRRGGVRMKGDRFELADGTPIKFWGTNLSYGGACAPPKKDAEFTAARFAKYGVNGVRLHKFSYPTNQMGIGERNDCTKMTADGLDRLDYFSAEMKKRGVYFGWSHTFGFHVCAGNRGRLVAYDEIERNLKGNTYGFINFARDVQDLMIEMVVNLLAHTNPYTGLPYAKEPALSFIELQNEDDIFFYTSEKAFNACPTYRKLFLREFCDWLAAKYGTQEKLAAAWSGALKSDETLAGKSVVPQTNPWFFGQDHLPGQKGGARQRLLDTAEYLHHLQNEFYGRFVRAIRSAGYEGPICGSPWQAPAMLPHYLNLKSDAMAGFIDRHNYYGGKMNQSQVGQPGGGYFSSGLQQVADRPFVLSEWITVYPSLYSADGPAIVAAYGLGLQGWDASYQFQSQSGSRAFAERAGWLPWGVWEADTPTQLGQYPALSRMVLRGDVTESPVISARRVSREDLRTGRFNFSEKVQQEGDVKSFGGTVPGEALAAGRLVVEFTDKPQPSSFPDLARYRKGTTLAAGTGELAWETAGGGLITINTAGTKAAVGFGGGKTLALGQVTIAPASPYASIFLTALEARSDLSRSPSALLTAVARNANTGFATYAIDGRIIENGKGPILLEPVKATISVGARAVRAVRVLDHDGRRTERTVPVEKGAFRIDTGRDKTIYYEVVFE